MKQVSGSLCEISGRGIFKSLLCQNSVGMVLLLLLPPPLLLLLLLLLRSLFSNKLPPLVFYVH
jgi:hypothetical protein